MAEPHPNSKKVLSKLPSGWDNAEKSKPGKQRSVKSQKFRDNYDKIFRKEKDDKT